MRRKNELAGYTGAIILYSHQSKLPDASRQLGFFGQSRDSLVAHMHDIVVNNWLKK